MKKLKHIISDALLRLQYCDWAKECMDKNPKREDYYLGCSRATQEHCQQARQWEEGYVNDIVDQMKNNGKYKR